MKRNLFLVMLLGILSVSCGQQGGNVTGQNQKELGNSQQTEKNLQETQGKLGDYKSGDGKVATVAARRARYIGDNEIGVVAFPVGWNIFKDPNAPGAVQMTKDGVHIVTVMKDPGKGKNSKESAQNMSKGFQNMGFKKEMIKLEQGKVRGKNAHIVTVNTPDGKILIMHFIDYNGKVYYVAVEGLKGSIDEGLDIINKSWHYETYSWNPDKGLKLL